MEHKKMNLMLINEFPELFNTYQIDLKTRR